MSNLQITLSIVGVLLIVAIIGHGLWTMRRNSQQMTRQARKVAAKRQQRESTVDNGFDDDGVGSVKVIDRTKANDPVEQMSMNLDIDDDDTPLPSMRVNDDDVEPAAEEAFKLEPESMPESQTDEPPQTSVKASREATASAKPEDNVDSDTPSQPESVSTQQDKAPAAKAMEKPQPAQEVISLFVKGSVQGAVLLQMMTELGCKFGEMGIFHRYEQTSGNGPLIFSVANMYNPGTFDLDNIENFETDGVAFFMSLPLDYDGQQAFNMMLNAAKKLAMEIPQGQVLDGQRQVLSRQSIQRAHHTIREFEKAQAGA